MSTSPSKIARQVMFDNDAFSNLMGMEIMHIDHGEATVTLSVNKDMTNGFGIAHGGISYSLADSAFAFACNSLGNVAVSIETSISHLKKIEIGDVLVAKSIMIHRSRKLGVFEVKVFNQEDALVADFKGTCYFTSKKH